MATRRKDSQGRVLNRGEVQRKNDKRYMYSYTDPLGRRKFIYANTLKELRDKERKLIKDQLDGLDVYAAGEINVNTVFDRYMSMKHEIRETTKANYIYMYDRFVRNAFGKKKIASVKYSDVKQFYLHLLEERAVGISTVANIHTLLHPVFRFAIRDELIRNNPTDGVLREVTRQTSMKTGVRHALTRDEQRAWLNFLSNHPVYYHWWPMFTILLGTGCRIGEALGLRWQDLDFEKNIISINHSVVYYPVGDNRKSVLRISLPKTEAGIREIPMIGVVREAFEMLREEQEEFGYNETVIDGMTGFIFNNRFGMVPNPQTVNRTIKRTIEAYNVEEEIQARKQNREPIIVPYISCHHLRHTFCTRLCEVETNLKVIQSVMGHKNIQTTMDIYAEATTEKMQDTFENLANSLDIF